MEGPLAVRDARPHDLSRYRRTAVSHHAWALRLLLVRAQGKAGLADRRAGHRSRIPDPRRSGGLDPCDTDAYQGRVRTRGAAAFPCALALVPGTLRARNLDPCGCRRAAFVRAALTPLAGAVQC